MENNNLKEEMEKANEKHRQERKKEMDNHKEARTWITNTLYPAFNELKKILKKTWNVEGVLRNEDDGERLSGNLSFKFEGKPFLYSVELKASSEGVIGRIKFGGPYKEVNLILNWKEKNIIDDFTNMYREAKPERGIIF